jgi:hypothetical protein
MCIEHRSYVDAPVGVIRVRHPVDSSLLVDAVGGVEALRTALIAMFPVYPEVRNVIARVATFNHLDPSALDPDAVERLRSTIKSTPGFVAGFHLRDPESGKALSFTVYESPEALRTAGEALGKQSEDPRVGIDPDDVDYYTEVIEF